MIQTRQYNRWQSLEALAPEQGPLSCLWCVCRGGCRKPQALVACKPAEWKLQGQLWWSKPIFKPKYHGGLLHRGVSVTLWGWMGDPPPYAPSFCSTKSCRCTWHCCLDSHHNMPRNHSSCYMSQGLQYSVSRQDSCLFIHVCVRTTIGQWINSQAGLVSGAKSR